jgi:hypothetical protein
MSRQGSILNLGRPLADIYRIGNEGLATISDPFARHTQSPPGPQTGGKVAT